MNRSLQHKLPQQLAIGALSWLVVAILLKPNSLQATGWVQVLLLGSPLVFVPLGLLLTRPWRVAPPFFTTLVLPSALTLSIAYLLPQCWLAGLLAVPWLLITSSLAIDALTNIGVDRKDISTYCIQAAWLYLPIGVAWAVADRLAWQPLHFSPDIVLLTAAHFHYAGFILPLITALVLSDHRTKWGPALGWAVIFGVPLVAIGITASKLAWPPYIETGAATVMALAGLGVAVLHIWVGLRRQYAIIVRCFWIIGGLCLGAGMVLALCYGWRTYFPIPQLSIPWMYAVHGTLNTLGVGAFILIGWGMAKWNKKSL